jgi:NADPH:quinone reductase-like Zn-dependent oxidoreductase
MLRSIFWGRGRAPRGAAHSGRVEFNLVDFYHNVLHLVGVDTAKLTGPAIAKIMDSLRAGFEDGHLRPLPVQTWTLERGIDAYAAVAKGATSSKQVLLPRNT